MLYNFYSGHTASFLSNILDWSLPELQPVKIELSRVEGNKDDATYLYSDKNGNQLRLGLYLEFYKSRFLGLGKKPSLHIDICETVQSIRHNLIATSSQYVTYYSRESGTKYENEKLKICKRCLRSVMSRTSIHITGNSFEELILSIEEDEDYKCKVANEDGYAINWQQISRAYRESKGFCCESCGYKLRDLQYSKYIQTHHINPFEKMNNRRENLKALCVKCHSEVDDYHKYKFSTLENQILLNDFEEFKKR
jgi:hypothetical protein